MHFGTFIAIFLNKLNYCMSWLMIMVKFILIILLFLNNLKLNLDYLLIGSAYLTHLIIHIDFLMTFYTFFILKYYFTY